jgi:hypothetical protein
MEAPSREVMLYGTDEPMAEPVLLKAGALSAEMEGGNLRFVRYDGCEMLRAISFIVRDKNWGTYLPRISHLQIDQKADRFTVTYDALAEDANQSLRYGVTITGSADGRLEFSGEAQALSEFLTDRTGFVVLHPIAGVSGKPCLIESVDGRTRAGEFPKLINPVQPMLDLRALTHEFAPGFKVTCRMEGDTFEMEDQRNWTDASYKTYSRPLALPWPYTLARGERVAQKVRLSVAAEPGAAVPQGRQGAVLAVQGNLGIVPPLGWGLEPRDARATREASGLLRRARPSHVVMAYDPGLGDDAATLAAMLEAGRAVGGEPWLEAVVRSIDGYAEEIAALGRTVRELGSPFSTVLVSPAPDLKCTLPGSPWPPCPPLADIYREARAAFPGARLGGGTFAYFTELNRKRPPTGGLDLVSFTTIALMHAGDDRSATGGLESLPAIADTVRSFCGGKPYHVGPSAIGMRTNPYGEAPMPNPGNIRQAMNRVDPRQRGLLAAAWSIGYFAHFARGGASAVTLAGGTGDFGLVHTRGDYPKPWYDQEGGLYPAFHAFKGLSSLAGCPLVGIRSSMPREIQALGALAEGKLQVWIANLTATAQQVDLPDSGLRHLAILDEHCFLEAAVDPELMDARERPWTPPAFELGAYAVARLRA